MAKISGIKVYHIDNEKCKTLVHFRFLNKNPFKSIYFAVLEMAAELAGGLLVYQKIVDLNINASMLLIENNNQFFKKATGRIDFSCNQGVEISEKLKNLSIGEVITIDTFATGRNSDNDEVCKCRFTWSIKRK